jgi:leucyl-tRNA synthetase
VRDRIEVAADTPEERCRELALASDNALRAIDGREVRQVVVRAPRLVNLVTS